MDEFLQLAATAVAGHADGVPAIVDRPREVATGDLELGHGVRAVVWTEGFHVLRAIFFCACSARRL